jgi:hypothetical protein
MTNAYNDSFTGVRHFRQILSMNATAEAGTAS